MRNFSSEIIAEIEKEVASTFYLLELDLTSNYYFTDRDHDIYYNGHNYLATGFEFSDLAYAANMSVDKVTIDIDNVGLGFSSLLLGEDVRNKRGILSFGCSYGLPHISDENLVGYWPLDETSGTNAPDESGNGNDGTLINMEDADWVDGVVGKCLSFDGVDEYVNTPYGSGIDPSTSPHSFSVWVKSNSPSSDLIFLSSGQGTDDRMYMGHHNGKWVAGIQDDGWGLNSGVTATTNWAHIVLVMDGSNAKMYINGEYKNQISYTSYTFNQNIDIGRHAGQSYWWDGLIDEVRIYNKALTADEVKALYDNPSNKHLGVVDLFNGLISDWQVSETKSSITLVNEFILWKKKALRIAQPSCPWDFVTDGSGECGYSGAETWCDHSYERCVALGNSDNFGGFRFLPSIMEKEIWWGRTQK